MQDLGYQPGDLEVQVSELLVATADSSDELIDDSVQLVLGLLRERLKMDVVFVSEFVNGQRVMRRVSATPGHEVVAPGDSSPLEESWCQRVVDGRLPRYIPDTAQVPAAAELVKQLPFPIGTHISTPIVLQNGEIYGTLCCFSFGPQEHPDPQDLQRLQYTAQLTAGKIDRRRAQGPIPATGDRRRPQP